MVSGTYVRERKYGLGRKRVRARNLARPGESRPGRGDGPARDLSGKPLQRGPHVELASHPFKHRVGEFGRPGVTAEVWGLDPRADSLERRLIDRP